MTFRRSLKFIRGPIGCAFLSLAFASTALAQDPSLATKEYRDRIKVDQTVQPLGDTPFGENVNLYKGGLSFTQTDIFYPGIGPTITLSRTYSIGGATARTYGTEPLSDWALTIPRIETIIPGNLWGVGEWKSYTGSYERCTKFGKVSAAPYTPLLHMHWWNGYRMLTPDGNSQTLLARDSAANTIKPSAGSYNIVTTSNWMLTCTPLANSGPNGIQGEGFLALAPDGTQYWFDHLVYGAVLETLIDETYPSKVKMARKMGYLYATKIRDRFGNEIRYDYDTADHLVSIHGVFPDDRNVSVTWLGNRVSEITVQPGSPREQKWKYFYGGALNSLTSVELPDHSTWSFSMNGTDRMDWFTDPQGCGIINIIGSYPPTTITMTHPAGLIGKFNVDYMSYGRSKVPNSCAPATMNSNDYDTNPPDFTAVSLLSKSFSGPGLTEQTWTYAYGGNPSTDPNCALTGCTASSWVDVGAPDGSTTRYTHSAEWGLYEGKLLSVVSGKTANAPAGLRTETHEYALTTQGPFPTHVGNDFSVNYAVNDGPLEYLTPETKVTTNLQGVTFVRTVTAFDEYTKPLAVTRASNGGAGGNFSKSETYEYENNVGAWVLGQTKKVSTGGQEVSRSEYHPDTALPISRYSFGLLQQTLGYDAQGMLSTVTDGRGKVTTLSQWYRGIPKLISFPTGVAIGATVNDIGKITSTSDELQNVTSYGYDAMGRLAGISYPTEAQVWNPLARSMVRVAGNDGSGFTEPYWKQTVQTGNGKTTTYYDARWLPVLVLTEDTGVSSSKSYVVQRFDGVGRQVFKSYPVASATVNSALSGITTLYDPLGRVIQVKQDSELGGPLLTGTEYLSGFQTRVTNPNGGQTTTSYQIFDSPSTDAPVRIDAPEGVRTEIARDVFGAPLTITRSGPGN